ncbi:MAG: RDD family protein [Ramlibacter sp.]
MDPNLEYVGFWPRVGAALVDLLLQAAIAAPFTGALWRSYDLPGGIGFAGRGDFLFNVVLPALAVLAFWIYKGATPGKMLVSARIVDAATGGPLTRWQAVLRYLAYFISLLPFGLGYLWVAFDRRKQGWHDKIAGTVVVRPVRKEPVRFPASPP